MAVIYLRHPVHGAKVASLDLEALNDEMNGWERYDPSAPAVDVEPENDGPTLADLAPVEAETAPVARRGRRKRTDDPAQVSEGA